MKRFVFLFALLLLSAFVSAEFSREDYRQYLEREHNFNGFEGGENFAVVVCERMGRSFSLWGHTAVLLDGSIYSFDAEGMRVFEPAREFVINYLMTERAVTFYDIRLSAEEKRFLSDYFRNFRAQEFNLAMNNCTHVVLRPLEELGLISGEDVLAQSDFFKWVSPHNIELALLERGIVLSETVICPLTAIP